MHDWNGPFHYLEAIDDDPNLDKIRNTLISNPRSAFSRNASFDYDSDVKVHYDFRPKKYLQSSLDVFSA